MKNPKWIPLSKLQEKSKSRPEGYYDEVVSLGTINGDNLIIDLKDVLTLQKKYDPNKPISADLGTCPKCSKKKTSSGSFPPITEQIRNAVKAIGGVAKAVATSQPVFVAEDVLNQREGICGACEQLKNDRCLKCGCNFKYKIKLATEKCPLAKW